MHLPSIESISAIEFYIILYVWIIFTSLTTGSLSLDKNILKFPIHQFISIHLCGARNVLLSILIELFTFSCWNFYLSNISPTHLICILPSIVRVAQNCCVPDNTGKRL